MSEPERLAAILHKRLLHNGRGGVDESLAAMSCKQDGADGRCSRWAASLIAAGVRVPAEPEAPDPYPWLAELEAQPVPAPEQLPGSHDLDFIRECVARNPGGYTDTFKYLLSLIPASQPPSGDARALFNEDEDAAMAHLNGFMVALRGWGLSANQDEMVAAIHVLQGFVVQHAVARQFSGLSDWFAAKEDSHE